MLPVQLEPLTVPYKQWCEAQSALAFMHVKNKELADEVVRLMTALTTLDSLRVSLMEPKVILYDEMKYLTPREEEVLIRIMAGDSTSAISKRLYVSESTTKTFIAHIYEKLGVHNRGGAAAAGVHMGLDNCTNNQ